MKRRWIATILLTAMLLTLTACSLPQDLPGGMATLTGRVTSKDERLLTVEVLEDNLHYDAGTSWRSRSWCDTFPPGFGSHLLPGVARMEGMLLSHR